MSVYGGWPKQFNFALQADTYVPKRAYRSRWKKSKKNNKMKMHKYKKGSKAYNRASLKVTYFKKLLSMFKRKSKTGRPKGSKDSHKRKPRRMTIKRLASNFNQGNHVFFDDDVNTGVNSKINWDEPSKTTVISNVNKILERRVKK